MRKNSEQSGDNLSNTEKYTDCYEKRNKKQINLRIQPNILEIFDDAALSSGIDRNNWITRACLREADRQGIDIPNNIEYILEKT